MKATQSQILEKLLPQIGLANVVVVEDEADADFDLNAALGTVDENRSAIFKPQLEESLRTELSSSINGRRGGELRNHLIKLTGIPRGQVEKIEKDEDAIKAAIAHKMALIEGDTKEATKKIDELIAAHNSEKEQIIGEWSAKEQAAIQKYIDRHVADYYETNILSDAPLNKKADRKTLAEDFKNHVSNNYTVKFDEDKRTVELMDKKNPALPALNGNQKVDLKELAKDFFTKRGVWETDTRNITAADAMQGLNLQQYQGANGQPINPEADPIGANNAALQSLYKQNGLAV